MKDKKGVLVVIVLILLTGIIGFIVRDAMPSYAMVVNNKVEGFNISIPKDTEGKINQIVYVDVDCDYYRWSEQIKLKFKSTTSDSTFEVYLKNTGSNTKQFFVIPDTALVGEKYELRSVILLGNGGKENEFYTSDSYVPVDAFTNRITYIETNELKYVTIKEEEETKMLGSLNSFSLQTTTAKLNDKIYVNLSYNEKVDYIDLTLINEATGEFTTRHINKYWEDEPYINLTGYYNPPAGTYRVDNIKLCANNECITYLNEKLHDKTSEGGMLIKFIKIPNDKLEIENDSENTNESLRLKAINLNTYEAVVGEKISVDVNAVSPITSALLIFYNKENNASFSAYVKEINNHGYFMLPSTTESGDYRLQKVILKDSLGNSRIFNVPEFEGDSYKDDEGIFYEKINLKVKEDTLKSKENFTFNMEDYSDLIAKKIDTLEDNAIITAICDNTSLVNGSLFKQIQETRKTLILKYGDSEWVFNGTDIVSPKSIDVSMILKQIEDSDFKDSNISNKVSGDDISVLSFFNNGTLPGKVLIRLNSTELDSKFGNNDVFVYYYNDEEDSLMKVALEVQKIEGYYEFYINHNSEYIISSKKLSDKIVSTDDSMLKLNEKNTSNKIADKDIKKYILLGVLSLVIVVLVVLLAKKKLK